MKAGWLNDALLLVEDRYYSWNKFPDLFDVEFSYLIIPTIFAPPPQMNITGNRRTLNGLSELHLNKKPNIEGQHPG